MSILSGNIITEKRGYYIKVKASLRKFLIPLVLGYEEATEEKTDDPLSHVIIRIRHKYNQYEGNKRIRDLLDPGQNALACEVDHDPHMRQRCYWWLQELVEAYLRGEWTFQPSTRPSRSTWKQPYPLP